MLFVRLFVLALLLHENTGLFTQGRSYFTTCFVPALGLNLPPRGMAALHGSLIALCAVLLVLPRLWVLYPLLFLALSLLLASYSLRLSNHLIAAWFMGLLLCLDLLFQSPGLRGLAPTPFFLSGVQIVVGLTYALAVLFHRPGFGVRPEPDQADLVVLARPVSRPPLRQLRLQAPPAGLFAPAFLASISFVLLPSA